MIDVAVRSSDTDAAEATLTSSGDLNEQPSDPSTPPSTSCCGRLGPASTAKLLNLSLVFSLTVTGLMMVPYFAPVAKTQFHFRPSYIGYIFAAYPLGYISSSLIMSVMNISHFSSFRLNAVLRLITFIDILSTVVFGALPYVLHFPSSDADDSQNLLNMLAFASMRLIQGISTGVLDVFLMLTLVRLFPSEVSNMVGQVESIAGLGILFGPPIGGGLYELGGFFLPIAVGAGLCGILVLATSLYMFLNPELNALFQERDLHYKKGANHSNVTPKHLKRLLKSPPHLVIGPALVAGFGLSSYTLVESMTPLHLHEAYGIEPGYTGLIMAAGSVSYAICAIAAGKLSARPSFVKRRPLVIVLGCFSLAISVFLIGPAYAVLHPAMATWSGYPDLAKVSSVLGLCAMGIVMPPVSVVGPAVALDAAKSPGDKLVPAAGAIINTFSSLGAFLGPVVGAHLIEWLGFTAAFYYYSCCSIVMGLLYFAVYTLDRCIWGKDVETVLTDEQFEEWKQNDQAQHAKEAESGQEESALPSTESAALLVTHSANSVQ
jgi:MFS family permease